MSIWEGDAWGGAWGHTWAGSWGLTFEAAQELQRDGSPSNAESKRVFYVELKIGKRIHKVKLQDLGEFLRQAKQELIHKRWKVVLVTAPITILSAIKARLEAFNSELVQERLADKAAQEVIHKAMVQSKKAKMKKIMAILEAENG